MGSGAAEGPPSPVPGIAVVEAAICLLAVKVALMVLGFRRLSPRLGRAGGESAMEVPQGGETQALHVRAAIRRVARLLPRRTSCLVRAIAAHLMLRRRGLPTTLFLGVDRPGGGTVGAHAWVHSGALCVIGRKNQGFTAVQRFVWVD